MKTKKVPKSRETIPLKIMSQYINDENKKIDVISLDQARLLQK
jgi:hypothetical protein